VRNFDKLEEKEKGRGRELETQKLIKPKIIKLIFPQIGLVVFE
jgi:hypothetical protein